jgi:hypothetical protein
MVLLIELELQALRMVNDYYLKVEHGLIEDSLDCLADEVGPGITTLTFHVSLPHMLPVRPKRMAL